MTAIIKNYRTISGDIMKIIILKFLTKKGEDAYMKIMEEGKKQSWTDRQISKKVADDSITNTNPLVVEIRVKIPWLAVQVELDKQIITGLEKYKALLDKDYKMEVI